MLTLASLKRYRLDRGLTPQNMATATGISKTRYAQLELHTGKMVEPWFKEAIACADVLSVPTITELVTGKLSGNLTQGSVGGTGPNLPTDIDMWRSGVELDMSTAFRVAYAFGLEDPLHLVRPPIEVLRQIWSITATGERASGPGICTWCAQEIVGDAGHLPTCLPTNLFAPRGRQYAPDITFSPTPRHAGGGHGPAGLAYGLKRIRAAQGKTQAEMGALFGVSSDYYAKMERCDQKMQVARAQCLANKLGIDYNTVYHL